MKDRAAVAVIHDGEYTIGYADRDIAGYTPTTYTFESYEGAKEFADKLNEDVFGLEPHEANLIVLSTMDLARWA